jgi:Carboxypeptidase regulatory-like domain
MRTSLRLLTMPLLVAGVVLAAPVGSIKGYIRDATAAAVPSTSVHLKNERTNTTQESKSDNTGLYQFLDLAPGVYSISAEVPGFRTAMIKSVTVLVDQIVSVDIVLEVGQITEVVEVDGGVAGVIEPEKSSTGTNFDPKLTANLPLTNRRFNDLALLTPGATFAAAGTQAGGFAAAGSRAQSTNWMIDGVNDLDPQVNGANTNFRIAEAVQELSVITTVPSVEFGRQSGAQVNVVTKSGTNQLHGSLFEFNRNDKLQATDFFTNKLGGTKNPLHRNQYGASLGGPVRKNKTFFFYSWEALQQSNPIPTTAVVPTLAQRAAVSDPIAKSLLQFFPLPTDPTQAAGRTNFVGNFAQNSSDNTHLFRIDHTLTDKDRLMGRYIWFGGNTLSSGTLPTNGTLNTPGSQNLAVTETHTFSPTFLLETRLGFSRNTTNFSVQDAGFNAAPLFPGVPGVVDANQNLLDSGLPNVAIAGYATLGGATNLPQGRITNTYELFVNAAKVSPFGWTRHTIKFGYNGRREETRRFLDGNSRGAITFTDFDHFAGTCPGCNDQSLLLSSSIRTGDTLSHWYRYPHAFYALDDIKVKPNLTINLGLRWELPSVVTEKSGRASNFVPGIGPVIDGTNRLLELDPTQTGRAAFTFGTAPITLPAGGVNADYKDFAPMFGFAYTPKFGPGRLADGKTVIRGGFRVSYDDIFNNIPVNQSLNAPFVLTTTQRAGLTQPAAGYAWNQAFNQSVPLVVRTTQAPGAPAVGLVSWNGIDPNARTSYAYNWNFSIQREVAKNTSVEVSYIGSEGHRLGVYLDANEPTVVTQNAGFRGSQAPNQQVFPFPQWAGTAVASDLANSTYNGLVVSSKSRINDLLTMNMSYTWSHGIDDASSFFGSGNDFSSPGDSQNLRAERGNSGNDQRHRFINALVFDVPVGNGRHFLGGAHGIVDQVFGGWSISAITNIASGNPFTVYANPAIDFSGFNSFADRPDIQGSGPLVINRGNPDNFFDPAYFGKTDPNALCPGSTTNKYANGCAPTGRLGTSPRNAYYGPGLISFDGTAAKTFRIHERLKLEYRADFFNALNHTNFAVLARDRSVNNGAFGTLSSTSTFNNGDTGGPRVIQMTLRLQF